MTQTKIARQQWMDIAKGVGIVLVAFGHAINGLVTAGLLENVGAVLYGYFAVYVFHMPLFFFLAGFTVPRSLARGRQGFLRSKLAAIVHPYLVWTVLQGLTQTWFSSSLNRPFDPQSLLTIGWEPPGHFWFLYALLLCHLFATAFADRVWLAAAICAGVYVGGSELPGLLAMTAPFLPFYVLGIWAGERPREGWWSGRITAAGTSGLLLAFVVAGALAGMQNGWQATGWIIIPAALCGVFATLGLSHLLEGRIGGSILAFLGKLSLSIYVMHVMAVAGTRIFLVKLGLFESPWMILTLATIVGVAAPVIAHLAFQRLGLLRGLGLGSPPGDRAPGARQGLLNPVSSAPAPVEMAPPERWGV